MRTSLKNRQNLKYALQTGKIPVYVYDEDGNIKYMTVDGETVPVTTGNYEMGYSLPIDFDANISMSNGDSAAVEFGIDYSNYDAVIVTARGMYPLTETSLIWFMSAPTYKDIEETIVDPTSADYRVIRVSESLNMTKYVLKKINHVTN